MLCLFISSYRAEREMVPGLAGEREFVEVFVDTPIDEYIRHDPKGLYAKAMEGRIKNFTGVDAPYQVPQAPGIHLHTVGYRVVAQLIRNNIVPRP